MAEWLQGITLNNDFVPDELTIYCLSQFVNLHALAYTSNFCWSTLANQFKLSEEELYDKSDIKLIYVGHNMYVELKHIRQPQPQLSSPNQLKSTRKTNQEQGGESIRLLTVVTSPNLSREVKHSACSTTTTPPNQQEEVVAKSTTFN